MPTMSTSFSLGAQQAEVAEGLNFHFASETESLGSPAGGDYLSQQVTPSNDAIDGDDDVVVGVTSSSGHSRMTTPSSSRRTSFVRQMSFLSGHEDNFEMYQAKSNHFRAASNAAEETIHPGRICVRKVLASSPTEWFLGMVILGNFAVIVMETDRRAETGEPTPLVIHGLNYLFFFIYVVEFLARMFAFGRKAFDNPWVTLDALIIAAGCLEIVMSVYGAAVEAAGTLRAMRMVRLLRLLRALKLFGALRELRKLLEMVTSCMRTLFWAFMLCFMVMTIWSIVAVELLGDIVKEMQEEDFWPSCEGCSYFFSSVMHCNLFLFQTVIAGDSWGEIAVPVTKRHPWAGFIFCGALLTIMFGVLNLVVAVVVDTFADMRSKDMSHMAKEMEIEEYQDKKELFKIFKQIDKDRSGDITYEELEDAATRVPGFRERLRVLDIDQADLQQLFNLIDRDGSGEVDPEEFIETLYRVKNTESKTATKIIKHYLMHMLPLIQKEQSRALETCEGLQAARRHWERDLALIKDILPQIETRQHVLEETMSDLRRNSDIRSQIAKHQDAIRRELIAIGRHVKSAMETSLPPNSGMPTPPPTATAPSFARGTRRGNGTQGDDSGWHDRAGDNRGNFRRASVGKHLRKDPARPVHDSELHSSNDLMPPEHGWDRAFPRICTAGCMIPSVGPACPPNVDEQQDAETGVVASAESTVPRLRGRSGSSVGRCQHPGAASWNRGRSGSSVGALSWMRGRSGSSVGTDQHPGASDWMRGRSGSSLGTPLRVCANLWMRGRSGSSVGKDQHYPANNDSCGGNPSPGDATVEVVSGAESSWRVSREFHANYVAPPAR